MQYVVNEAVSYIKKNGNYAIYANKNMIFLQKSAAIYFEKIFNDNKNGVPMSFIEKMVSLEIVKINE